MNVIVAVDKNWVIGKDGDQLIYLSEDLKRFKALTLGHPVILGRKTLSTFPGGRPLKGRPNLILSATPGYQVEGAEVFPNLESLLSCAPEDAFVIGGLQKQEVVKSRTGIPFLKDIPYVKYLFSTESTSVKHAELVVVARCQWDAPPDNPAAAASSRKHMKP